MDYTASNQDKKPKYGEPFTIHFISCSLASNVRWIHRSSQAKSLINFTYAKPELFVNINRQLDDKLTAATNSFRTPMRVSLAAMTPFWILTVRLAM
jgi:hypothetical protein